jgi:curli production assembly/transport component CsgG
MNIKLGALARVSIFLVVVNMAGCANLDKIEKDPVGTSDNVSTLAPVSKTHYDLRNLPKSKGKITASVYGFRDQTGQYRPAPSSSFSTAVTQGAASILVKALLDSDWFVPVEREGLNNLLTERKIIRAANSQSGKKDTLSPLLSANILLEGGIVAYDTNVKTGGAGARYLGIGASEQYRMDQVTVNLRAIDIRSGRVLGSVSTSKTIFSVQLDTGVFKFIRAQKLLELEAGYSNNEPVQLCVTDAIESSVIHLIAQGLQNDSWRLQNPDDLN